MTDPDIDPVHLEAMRWFVLMKDEAVDPAERRAFEAWLRTGPEQALAYERAQALWSRFDAVGPAYERMGVRRGLGRRAMVLGVGAAAVGGTVFYGLSRPDHATGVGERREVRLPDGSLAELGSRSALSVDFSARRRTLVLHRGEAFLAPVADLDRPFVVKALEGTTRALGTRFNVKISDGRVAVAVEQHAVAVAAGGAERTLGEGMQVAYDRLGLGATRPVDLKQVLAWRRDRILFQDVPLRAVLVELERYRRGRIVLTDRAIGEVPVTAVFDVRDADRALDIVAQSLPIRVTNLGGGIAVISPA